MKEKKFYFDSKFEIKFSLLRVKTHFADNIFVKSMENDLSLEWDIHIRYRKLPPLKQALKFSEDPPLLAFNTHTHRLTSRP